MNQKAMQTDILRNSPGKLYLNLASLMRRRLTGGEWEPGDQIPPLTALAAEFGVANVTVRQAIAILEDEGLVHRQQGRGTFVSPTIDQQPSFSVVSDWSSLIRMVEKGSPKLIKVDDTLKHPVLHRNEGTPAPAYRYIKKVYSYHGLPCAVVGVYLDKRCFDRAPKRFQKETIIPVLETLPDVKISHWPSGAYHRAIRRRDGVASAGTAQRARRRGPTCPDLPRRLRHLCRRGQLPWRSRQVRDRDRSRQRRQHRRRKQALAARGARHGLSVLEGADSKSHASWPDFLRCFKTIMRGSLIGVVMGAIPGVGDEAFTGE